MEPAACEFLEETESTNLSLRSRVEALLTEDRPIPQGLCVATLNQTAGRGRQGRDWEAMPGDSLALSVLVRFGDEGLSAGWLPLIAGAAVARVLRNAMPGSPIGVKWPNDVLVIRADGDERKICGILCEVLPAPGPGLLVAVGMGVNLFAHEVRLPVESATSVRAEFDRLGDDAGRNEWFSASHPEPFTSEIIANIKHELLTIVQEASTNPAAVRDLIQSDSVTIGTEVHVHLHEGVLEGTAIGYASDGSLTVRTTDGEEHTVSAGDVEHVRRRARE